jgi:mono/diheme cytochrome c family protein
MNHRKHGTGNRGPWWREIGLRLMAIVVCLGLSFGSAGKVAWAADEQADSASPTISSYERFFRSPADGGGAPDGAEAIDDDVEEDLDAELEGELDAEPQQVDPSLSSPLLAGQLLVAELNCVACHALPDDVAWPVSPKSGPVLTEATGRIKPNFIRQFLADPQRAKPGTTMPHVGHDLPADVKEEQVEALLHYLTSIGGQPESTYPTIGSGARGKELFHQVGCMACHGDHREGEPSWRQAVPLGSVESKYTLSGLTRFLLDPLHVRRDGRMPDLNLSSQEAMEIAAFLLKLPEVARLRYDYYHGNWQRLPDFSRLTPVRSGGAEEISLDVARRRDRFGLRFQGYLRIDRQGEYTFHLGSDDGSRLILDGSELIDHDGVHPFTVKSATVSLTPGQYPLVVEYFERDGEEALVAEYEGPGLSRQPISRAMSAERESPMPDQENLVVALDQSRVAAGRTLFRSLGCAACHEVAEQDSPVRSTLEARPLRELNPDQGCLAEQPVSGVPDYALREDQRDAIAAALDWLRGEATPGGLAEQIHLSMASLQCYACHERQGVGGVERSLRDLFATTIPEMGDEGRLPPPLTGVGAKLTEDWLARLLIDGSGDEEKDRPYMLARMPRFGKENAGHLVSAFAAADPLPEYPELPPHEESQEDLKEIGRVLVGEKGAACIKCHTFGRFDSQGIQSMDLRIMARRLRPEWFRPYMRNPQLFRPGTRMPSAWPITGPSFFEEFFDGDSDQQVGAIWEYLQDGERARIPSGMVTPSMELVPIDDAIIYRNFIEGAGPRGIGVGYPEGVHQAFDANEMRIALLWEGRFIDASRHWSGRGQGFQPPAGDKVLALPSGPPFARLSEPDGAWPTEPPRESGYRFLGYRLTPDQRPTFRYRYDDVEVEEFLETRRLSPGSAVPRRHVLRADPAPTDLWMRVASGRQIDEMGDGWFRVDDQWNVRLASPSDRQPEVRRQGGLQELVLKVEFAEGEAEITTEFSW